MIHLDTSFLIRALVLGAPEDRKLRGWIGEGKTLGMSTVAWAELLCGPLKRSEMEWALLHKHYILGISQHSNSISW